MKLIIKMKGWGYMNKKVFTNNRNNLMERVQDNSIVLMFAGKAPKKSADENYPFTPNRNFYYLTGINEPDVVFLAVKNKEKVEETIFIKKADPVMERWVGKTISSEEAIEVSGVEDIKYVEDLQSYVHKLIFTQGIDKIYLNIERDGFEHRNNYEEEYADILKNKYPYIDILNIFNDIAELRMVKCDEEIEEIRKAGDITIKGVESLMKNAKAGMKEYELEAYFDFVLKQNGVKDYAFKTIAAAGKNATVLHYVTNDSEIKDGDLILFDLGAQLNYYNSDISRTFPVNGKFTERQKTIYNIVLKAHSDTIKAIKPGIPFPELNKVTRKSLGESLKAIGLINNDEELSQYYFHGVSHHLGLDTHDVGSREAELKEGMILTVEPGLYIAEEGIGIRIEDDVVVTKDGCEIITKGMIRTVEEIEAFMANR